MITKPVSSQDNRWFIWAIVFLLVSGVSLVSYIMISDISSDQQLTSYSENIRQK